MQIYAKKQVVNITFLCYNLNNYNKGNYHSHYKY